MVVGLSFPWLSLLVEGRNILKTKNAGEAFYPFCNAIKVLKLLVPEFSRFVDISEKKVTIYFMLLNTFEHKTEEFMSW